MSRFLRLTQLASHTIMQVNCTIDANVTPEGKMSMLPIRDVSLFVKVMGQGVPLLLMHGGPGLDHSTLSSLEPLADQFTLIFYDHRCNGRSTGAFLQSARQDAP